MDAYILYLIKNKVGKRLNNCLKYEYPTSYLFIESNKKNDYFGFIHFLMIRCHEVIGIQHWLNLDPRCKREGLKYWNYLLFQNQQ